MDFGQAIKSVFSQYATFSGRASRSEFWWFFLFQLLVTIVLQTVGVLLQTSGRSIGLGPALLVSLVLLVPYLAVSVRRLHDSNRSGFWLLALLGAYGLGILTFTASVIGGLVAVLSEGFNPGSVSGGMKLGLAALAVLSVILLLGSAIMWVVQMVRGSTPGTNRYGPHPLPGATYGGLPGLYGTQGAVPGPAPYDAQGHNPWGPPAPPA